MANAGPGAVASIAACAWITLSAQAQVRSFPDGTGVVFPAERAEEARLVCRRFESEAVWTPSGDEIASLESGLLDVLENRLMAYGAHDTTPTDYYRQYAGVIVDGRRIVCVNGFHRIHLEDKERLRRDLAARGIEREWSDWRDSPVVILDGGLIMFGVEYDVERRTFWNFSFNGTAT